MSSSTALVAPAPLTLAGDAPALAAWALDPELRHLNHGSFGGVPYAALEHQAVLREQMERAPVAWFPNLPARVAEVRATLAAVLGVAAERLALVPNASAGASVAFNCLPLPTGADVLVTDHGYGAVTLGAARAARRIGGRLVTAQVPLAAEEDEAFDAIWAGVTDRTALIVLDQITSPTARGLPVSRVCAEARRRGIWTLVDGAHAPLLLPSPVSEAGADADVWVGNLHKYGCAPRGTAVLVARPEVAAHLYPLIDSWGADLDFPVRFDHQGTLDLTSWLAAPTALQFVEDAFGWTRVRTYSSELAGWAQDLVASALSAASGEDCYPAVGMAVGPLRLVGLPGRLATGHVEANGLRDRMLAETGIETAFTAFTGRGYCRLSAHAYNTAEDYLDFVERGVPLLLEWAAQAAPRLHPVHPEERREQ